MTRPLGGSALTQTMEGRDKHCKTGASNIPVHYLGSTGVPCWARTDGGGRDVAERIGRRQMAEWTEGAGGRVSDGSHSLLTRVRTGRFAGGNAAHDTRWGRRTGRWPLVKVSSRLCTRRASTEAHAHTPATTRPPTDKARPWEYYRRPRFTKLRGKFWAPTGA